MEAHHVAPPNTQILPNDGPLPSLQDLESVYKHKEKEGSEVI